ncbi:cytochrome P450 ClCP1 [Hypoxylon fragiforme]|uniref:cytochrome P450 ClCP1 n=1 Tax=Hypoxylon fragiforme TaxID=63214 RepID=UPI0020C6892E|nr:cytochrome P450 ClCP1 [Hypoxylon fragiforme]KAI2614033.1 cytochrome P450 ClCP1 [Hypoxylon fragiforme]
MAPLLATGPLNLALVGCTLAIVYFVALSIYNVFLHPLRSFPGPFLWRMSHIPRSLTLVRGKLPIHMKNLHAKYGPVVRISPNELAFSDPQAWKDIYGHRSNGEPELAKYELFYRVVDHIPRSIINAYRDEHAFLRRQMAHGFSERAMQAQEPIIGSYVDLLIYRLQERCADGVTALNMREWLNYTTFDVIGDLGFGSSFKCLEDSDYHPWVKLVTTASRQNALLTALSNVGLKLVKRAILRLGNLAVKDNLALVRETLLKRIENGIERPDFVDGLIRKKKEGVLDLGQLVSTSSTLIIAGSETTATLLTGVVYLLTTNPDKLNLLTKEVRSAFTNDEEITLTSVGKLTYMLACLNEALRRYPPVPAGLPRQAPKGGCYIMGQYIPEGTVVAVWQHAINHDERFWTKPYTYAPERFMGGAEFKNDQTDAMQPFSVGPRNCIGRNLAYAEMRLILAKIIYNFDMTIDDDSRDWLRNQPAYNLWDKPALNIHMKPVPAGKQR